MISRRDFLKVSSIAPLAFLRGDSLPRLQAFDIVSAFSNVQDGDVINIPPGYHLPTSPLSLRNKKRVTVNGNGASIWANADFAGEPVLDMSGTWGCKINNLHIQTPAEANALAAIVVGRTSQGDGANNIFHGLQLEGVYMGATVYSVCAEVNTWRDCFLQTFGNAPVIINSSIDLLGYGLVESSNCVHWLSNCTIVNYGTAQYNVLHYGTVEGAVYEKCHMFLNGAGFRMESSNPNDGTWQFRLSDIRAEGSGLLIDNAASWAKAWDISRISHMIQSDYIIQSSSNITDSKIDMTFGSITYADKFLRLIDGAQLERVDLIGDWTNKIVTA